MIQHYPFEVLPLPYLYDSLEPNINMETMFFHHSKHLAAEFCVGGKHYSPEGYQRFWFFGYGRLFRRCKAE